MARIDIEALVDRTRTILDQPEATIEPTDDTALDAALASLAQRKREGQPLEAPRLSFWDAPPVPARDPRP
ncbi:MAG: hypothetical protein ACRDIE_13025 [Chloroflexota bacterium]